MDLNKNTRMKTVKVYHGIDKQEKDRKIIRDSKSGLLMEEQIYKNYFVSRKKKPELFWAYVLGTHPALRNLYGIEKTRNDLALYW